MGSKANPAAIGAFVVGAIGLAVVGVLVFGSGRLFKQTTKCVCFFTGDLNGLDLGAPVKFKGVEIGSVADIRIRLSEESLELTAETVARGIRIPVVIEIDNQKLTQEGAKAVLSRARLKELIDLGLRAQLVSQSLVTGLLMVQLDFHRDTPATFVLPPDSGLLEIPTIPTSLERVQSAAQEIVRKLEDVHFDALVKSGTEALDAIKDVARSPGLQQALQALPETLANMNDTITSLRQLAIRLDREQEPLLQSLKAASQGADLTLERARLTIDNLQRLLDPNAPLVVDFTAAMQELGGAAHSVRLLADYLERHPSALVRGKYVKEE